MAIDVYEVFQNANDRINEDEGGYMTVEQFNRYSWLGQLRFMDWLSGSVQGKLPPEAYVFQKSRDWISPFITIYEKQVENGKVTKPENYYKYESAVKKNGTIKNEVCGDEEDADEDEYEIVPDTVITLLENSKFAVRLNTYIESLKPSVDNPIAKMVGKDFHFEPKDLGSVAIEYLRYPVRSELIMDEDPVYNDKVYNKAASTQFEWGEYARPMLVAFICQEFYNSTRDFSGVRLNDEQTKDL